jgi:hypothetical protein
MRGRTLALLLAVIVLAPTLIVTSALADLRSPAGTAELGAELADDPAVQALLVAAVVDAVIADAVDRSPAVAALAPLVRPLLTRAVEATIVSPAGRSAITVALTDALRQLTVPGPIVIDLRAAVLVAADDAPPPLDTLARTAVEQGVVGLVVIGEDGLAVAPGDLPTDDRTTRDRAGTVAGLPSDVALALAALALALALAVYLAVGDRSPRVRLAVSGTTLIVVGALGAVLLRLAPGVIVERVVPLAADDAIADALPTLVAGIAGLLGRTGTLSLGLLVLGVALLVASRFSAAGSPPAGDRPLPS